MKLSQLRKLASFEDLLIRFEALVAGETAPPSSGSAPKPVTKPPTVAKPSKPELPPERASAPDENDWTAEVPPLGEAEAEPSSDFMGQLVEQLKTSKPMLHAIVSHHASYELDGNRLTLEFFRGRAFTVD